MSPDLIFILGSVVFLAGLIRGYTGFGFAAIAVVGLNLYLTPQQSIPIVLGLDIICSITLWKQAVAQADKKTFKLLTTGAMIGIPIGTSLLFIIPSQYLKILICTLIFILSMLLIFEVKFSGADKNSSKFFFGLMAGAGTSSTSVGGPMIVSYMLSSTLTPAVQRGTMIMYFVVSETIAMCVLFINGLLNFEILKFIGILLIPTLISVRCGQSLFNWRKPSSLKHVALPIMLMVASLGISASLGK
ncbi:sulfite exporter TauE/SafE family protein [Photobacterium sp. ZSDE20]|uniref:Probable membrane transporter protein n=1 Tax=Photobacterium pectinilyticum TaxID=2906793 RepID=A0ABT1N7S5_9GAMM|nr:sulfite exporter TauE/SafE family protein [Photobacterium sp. ZSDE20]MCQ1060802.1 sulfite exporter TauE/SafE family protein [Photobacterium sp. ZSDE20]MDD1828532.1 sulfite exporter TauE/SafE family protein [Photobacterium sp. ZSDE20]